jgi:hypothetical protein
MTVSALGKYTVNPLEVDGPILSHVAHLLHCQCIHSLKVLRRGKLMYVSTSVDTDLQKWMS